MNLWAIEGIQMKFRKDIKESGGSAHFLKLKDKESVQGIFRGELNEIWTVWEGQKSREVPEGTPGSKFRFRVNFVMKDSSGNYTPKIFEQGRMVYETLAALHDEYNLEQTIIKISRSGEKMDTTYQLLPLRQTLSPETMKALDHLKLLDLKHVEEPNFDGTQDFDKKLESEELPF